MPNTDYLPHHEGIGFIHCGRLPGGLGGHDGLFCLGQAGRASNRSARPHTRQFDAEEAVVELRRVSILCGRLNRDPLDGAPSRMH